ncbi:hypothetical protein ZEAMMB73_Zm00001d051315 [Zea mays]|uniref:Uncharacterized protein n=1 Tax=Zea mays TaxID=4577 RepID=K7UHH9_MAIZE|nr:hypothetical protein ZEAMMB73_Zm00001d051315 [Zea mays]
MSAGLLSQGNLERECRTADSIAGVVLMPSVLESGGGRKSRVARISVGVACFIVFMMILSVIGLLGSKGNVCALVSARGLHRSVLTRAE